MYLGVIEALNFRIYWSPIVRKNSRTLTDIPLKLSKLFVTGFFCPNLTFHENLYVFSLDWRDLIHNWEYIHLVFSGYKWEALIREYNKQHVQPTSRRGKMKADFYPVGPDFSLSESAKLDHFTFTFVRYPISRLVSGYTNKMAKNWAKLPKNESFRDVKDEIAIKSGLGPQE